MRPSQITKELKKHGLAGLYERELLPQIGFLIHNHELFKRLLTTVEPGKREECYRAMTPHLPFKAKPLDVYLAEAGREADAKKLPVFDARTGEIHDHGWVDPQPAIQKAANDAIAEHSMTLSCKKCTRVGEFRAWMPEQALREAQKEGWVRDGNDWICPKCPAVRLV